MTTHATDDELNRLADKSLDSQRAKGLHTHVASCEVCQGQVASISRLLERSAALGNPVPPRRDLWPVIEAATSLPLRRRHVWTPLAKIAAAVVLTASLGAGAFLLNDAGHKLRAVWTRIGPSKEAPAPSARWLSDVALLRRASLATRDAAFFERRRLALSDSLTAAERSVIEDSPAISARLNQIDSLTVRAEAEPQNSERANAVGVALDAWYFDVQQVRRSMRGIAR